MVYITIQFFIIHSKTILLCDMLTFSVKPFQHFIEQSNYPDSILCTQKILTKLYWDNKRLEMEFMVSEVQCTWNFSSRRFLFCWEKVVEFSCCRSTGKITVEIWFCSVGKVLLWSFLKWLVGRGWELKETIGVRLKR